MLMTSINAQSVASIKADELLAICKVKCVSNGNFLSTPLITLEGELPQTVSCLAAVSYLKSLTPDVSGMMQCRFYFNKYHQYVHIFSHALKIPNIHFFNGTLFYSCFHSGVHVGAKHCRGLMNQGDQLRRGKKFAEEGWMGNSHSEDRMNFLWLH